MTSLIIVYDKHAIDDYHPLIRELRRLGAFPRQKSEWELVGRTDAEAVGRHLETFLDADDKLDVFETGVNRYTRPARGLSDILRSAIPHSTVANALASYPTGGLGRLIK